MLISIQFSEFVFNSRWNFNIATHQIIQLGYKLEEYCKFRKCNLNSIWDPVTNPQRSWEKVTTRIVPLRNLPANWAFQNPLRRSPRRWFPFSSQRARWRSARPAAASSASRSCSEVGSLCFCQKQSPQRNRSSRRSPHPQERSRSKLSYQSTPLCKCSRTWSWCIVPISLKWKLLLVEYVYLFER